MVGFGNVSGEVRERRRIVRRSVNVGEMGNSADEPGIYDRTWRRFLEESEIWEDEG